MEKCLDHLISIDIEPDSVLITGVVEQQQSGEEDTSHLLGLGRGDAGQGAGGHGVHAVEVVLNTFLGCTS